MPARGSKRKAAASPTPTPASSDLYATLGVANRSASLAELKRAYHQRALRVHPDKCPDDPAATEEFQRLCHAYEVLSNPERRKIYDETGTHEGTDDADVSAMAAYLRKVFPKLDGESIDRFSQSYRESAVEREDVLKFVSQQAGDCTNLLEVIMCSEPEDIPRFVTMIDGFFGDGSLEEEFRASYKASLPKLQRAAKRSMAERRKLQAEAPAAVSARSAGAASGDGLEALAALMRQRRQDSSEDLMARLEAKYAKPARAVKRKPAAAAGDDG
eukprot:TRINITY_DN8098_c0_g1_i2.p1 TRINITY_DN8098_c0_g1~~TRINITY_DN8098_c0_g1_i2.p1  ORF type:complete len:272 (-),score=72.89 TRINITY_DN8098_c0_g1_i2:134-949(-)